MTRAHHKRSYWIFGVDPRHYHWDTLFVKGKEMWRGAGAKLGVRRLLKLVHPGDRVLCYHGAPERALYAIAQVTRAPYPDPLDPEGRNQVIDLRAVERLPRQVKLAELKESPELRKLKLLKDVRQTVSPVTEAEYEAILRLAGIVPQLGIPLP